MSRKYFTKYAVELVKEDDCQYEAKIDTAYDAYRKILEVFRLDKKAEEYCVMFCLDSKNNAIGAFLISKGSINLTSINVTDIIKRAILCNSKRIIIAHNHPSGSTEPSKHDIAATKKITEACNLMGINLLDHLIIGDKQFKSIIEQK